MWPRIVELMLGVWLALSPFVFRHAADDARFWINDFATAAVIVACSLLSFTRLGNQAHAVTFAVGLWLAAFGYLASGHPSPPALQNNLVVGLLLMLMAVLPNHVNCPPRSWRQPAS